MPSARSAAGSPSVTEQVCTRLVEWRQRSRGDAVEAAATRLVLDGVAVAVAGSGERAVRLLAEHHQAYGGPPAATALGRSVRLSMVAAAAVNGAAMHVLDFEPMWSPSNHALSTTLPVALAVAEAEAATETTDHTTSAAPTDGAAVLRALVDGIELQGWLRQASHQWEASQLTFHPPGVVGPLGAAVTAGQLLGLDALQLRHALGLAASRSGGLMANVGTMTKATHCGNAAAAGLEAALLAARGFTANPDILDVALGLGQAFSPDFAVEEVLGLGPPYRVVEPGYAIKMFPSQFGTHFGITAALAVRARLADPARIAAVRLTVPAMHYVDRPLPTTGLAGKFSLQYTAAVALADGAVTRRSFTDERVQDPAMQRLLERTALVVDPSIPGRFEEMHVVLEVELDDGSTLTERCDGPAGIWGSRPISTEEHLVKVRDCLSTVLPDDEVEAVIEGVGRFAQLDGAEVRQLIERCGTAP